MPSLRRAAPGDAGALAACIDAAYAGYRAAGIDLPPVSEGIADDIRDHIAWVAVHDDEIVGGLVLVIREDVALIANVAVHPAASGTGLGRALMQQAETEARERGLPRMTLTTHADMPGNLRLYEHLGWRETGRDGNKVRMEKAIADRSVRR